MVYVMNKYPCQAKADPKIFVVIVPQEGLLNKPSSFFCYILN